MGCWNETCMVSHLPIFSGEKVVAIPIAESMHHKNGSQCYACDRYAPFMTPIFGEYNDYGSVENDEGKGFALHYANFLLAEKILAKEDASEWNSITDFVSDLGHGNVCVNSDAFPMSRTEKKGERVGTSVVFIRRDVFDKLLSGDKMWIRQKGIAALADSLKSGRATDDLQDELQQGSSMHEREYDLRQLLAGRSFVPESPSQSMVRATLSSQDPVAIDGLKKLAAFRCALEELRMAYMPTSGAGSQQEVGTLMLEMNDFIAQLGHKLAKEQEEELDEE